MAEDEEAPAFDFGFDMDYASSSDSIDEGFLSFINFLKTPTSTDKEEYQNGNGVGFYCDAVEEEVKGNHPKEDEEEEKREEDIDDDGAPQLKRNISYATENTTKSMNRTPSIANLGSASSLKRMPSLANVTVMKSFRSKSRKKQLHYRTERDASQVDGEEKEKEEEEKALSTKRLTPWISYELFSWMWFSILACLSIADRFVWNVWPRQTYTIGAGSAGSDRTVGFKPGPWSVVLYDVLARVSGRYSIICYNFILMTRLECLEHLMTSSFVSKYLLDTSNIINANTRLHYWNGIGLCVMTLLHVWSIVFPCITHGYTAVVVPGVFEWPLSERSPVKCSKSNEPGCWPGDANPELKQMGLQADDVFRMVEMTLFLAILMPISIKWFASRWHAGIQLHRLINLVYFVDIVRRHSHPHSWILNTPVFVLYIFDKYVFTYYFRRNKTPEVRKIKLGNDFMVLYWKSPFGFTDALGPDYSMLLNNTSLLEEKHVFTCFENRSGIYLGDGAEDFDWTVGVVVRVFRRARVPRIGEVKSHTQRMFDEDPSMLITGPRQGEMSETVRLELLSPKKSSLILVGAGSAVNFIIDTLQWCSKNNPIRKRISLLYTTRDYDLFWWSMTAITNLIPSLEAKGIFLDINMAFTGSLVDGEETLNDSTVRSVESAQALRRVDSIGSVRSIDSSHRSVKTQPNRFKLGIEIGPKSTVYCQGSAGLKDAVNAVCEKVGATFYGGRGGAREDQL